MMERALKGDLKAMFWMYTTHIHLPDVRHARAAGADQDVRRRPGHLPPRAQPALRRRRLPGAAPGASGPAASTSSPSGALYVSDGVGCSYDEKGDGHRRGASGHGHGHRQGQVASAEKLGLDAEKIFPYKKPHRGPLRRQSTIPRRSSGTSCAPRKGSDADLTGMLEVKRARRHRPLRPDPPAARHPVAGADLRDRQAGRHAAPLHGPGGLGGRRPTAFPQAGGKATFKLCEQDYGEDGALLKRGHRGALGVRRRKPGEGPWLYREPGPARCGRATTPSLPSCPTWSSTDDEAKTLEDATQEDKYPFWLGPGHRLRALPHGQDHPRRDAPRSWCPSSTSR